MLSTNQTKRILQKVRQINYPSDEDYLEDISKITITFENEINLENLNLCWKNVLFINPSKKYKAEWYVIFSTIFQMNLIEKYI